MALKKTRAKARPQPSLSKPQEAALMRVYNAYWDGYIKGDVKAVAKLLDEQYTQVGSAEGEVFFSKKDAVKFLHDTIDQVAGKAEMRNRVIRVEPHKEFVLITEQTDLFVLIEGTWAFHSKFRASSLMRKRKDGWKFYHQHSSFPDIRAGEGENISIEKVALENIQLRDAVKRRTVELEQKTHDLKVEATLEHVRARAMAMRNSSELAETSAVLFHQINELGINVIRTSVGILDDPNNAMELWVTTSLENKETVKILDYVNLHIHPVFENIIPARKAKKPYALTVLKGNEVRQYYSTMSTYMAQPKQLSHNPEEFFYSFFFSQGAINVIATQGLTVEECTVMTRVANVFGVIYTRFLDLKKAEEQTREAQIELALERVRARTMAMHKSDELVETSVVLFQELKALGVSAIRTGVAVFNKEKETMELWSSQLMEHKQNPVLGVVPVKLHPFFDNLFEAWKRNDPDFTFALSGSEVKEYYQATSGILSYPPQKDYNSVEIFNPFFFPEGSLTVVSHDPLTDEERNIMRRFASVFGLLYRRFLDLQKAEAQAREAQIEAALERVRAQTMAMHNSADVGRCVVKMFSELTALGVHEGTRFGIGILNQEDETSQLWTARKDGAEVNLHIGNLDMTLHPLLKSVRKAWKEQTPLHQYVLEGKDLVNYYQMISKAPDYKIPIAIENLPEKEFHYGFIFYQGFFYAFSPREFQAELLHATKRFAKVFEQTYTRFLDLKKAEAQARESQIEAALEKVRSRSLAMHKSAELQQVINLVFDRLADLGIRADTASVSIPSPDRTYVDTWLASKGYEYSQGLRAPWLTTTRIAQTFTKAYEAGLEYQTNSFTFDEKNEYLNELFSNSDFRHIPEERKAYVLGLPAYGISAAGTKLTWLQMINYNGSTLTDEQGEVLKRFARVFEQCYIRFQDLEKAEAQAREAHLEASLERVRGKAMGMHNSSDLVSTIKMFYQELELINLKPRRCGVGLLNRNNKLVELSTISQGTDGAIVESAVSLAMEGHPVLDRIYESYLKQQEYHPVLRGNEIKKYNQAIRPQADFPDFPEDAVTFGYFFYVEDHGVYAWTDKELSEDDLKVYRRFTSVLTLTYKRYKELKDAEERARIAVREASLDRVRAEIASMRHADDLQRITPLVWRELGTLGVPFFRCGVLIVNEQTQKADYYLSTPEGQPLAALHLDFNTRLDVVQTALQHWREQKVYIDHWTKEQFIAFARSMMELGQIQTMKSYQGGDQPPEEITLQFVPFTQGMLYVGSKAALSREQLDLMKALADAFSTAYARYEDFTRLEAAKAQVENTLKDLRTTQTQLVQSEKMASLGELTAGIAHEIQNPLNFVNNFSEVSKELLDEMEEELKKGNAADAKQIARNVIENLEKITFHGKRADGIVKSMLQHSRKSTGQKELTDINALCDEYLRLSYHGLRAKDKSFNAKFETVLDPHVGNLNVLPQEIGRVILNLINNAFYAVSEKKKLNQDGYEPTVMVTTKKTGSSIEIRVKDNGTGIPQKALDKIFNPFFTTKPTGQGTGLGLSLSYDIITKGHGGELKVETKDGEGSEFTIQLPTN